MRQLYQFFHRCLMRLHLDYYRTIHSFKTALACSFGLGLEWYFKWPSGQWVPITIMVVMSAQPHFGAAVQKAYMRFLGTAAGVMITLLTLIVLRDNTAAVFVVLFLSCAFFTYIASAGGNISYAGTLGGVTVILTLTAAEVSPQLAVYRGCYIVVGIIIALLASRFIFPIHAREALRFSVASVLRRLQRMYFATISHSVTKLVLDNELDAAYRKIVGQTQLLDEASAGSLYFKKNREHLYSKVIHAERKLYRLINLMGKNLLTLQHKQIKVLQQINGLDALHISIENRLEALALYFETVALPPQQWEAKVLLQVVIGDVRTLPAEDDVDLLLQEHSCLFFLEQIVHELEQLYLTIIEIDKR